MAHLIGEGLERFSRNGNEINQPRWLAAEQNRPISKGCVSAWPSRPGEHQYGWEPPRVVGNAKLRGSHDRRVYKGRKDCWLPNGFTQKREHTNSKAEPALGGNADGSASGLDYAELCVTNDNRTDELRLLGNGVVPATAEIAFKTLMNEMDW